MRLSVVPTHRRQCSSRKPRGKSYFLALSAFWGRLASLAVDPRGSGLCFRSDCILTPKLRPPSQKVPVVALGSPGNAGWPARPKSLP